MPGYTGHVNGVYETFGTTPVASQRKALFRTGGELDPVNRPKVAETWRDPCNNPATFQKNAPELLWPQTAAPHSIKKNLNNQSSIVFGDRRFVQDETHYTTVHAAPAAHASVWDPIVPISTHKYDLSNKTSEQIEALYKNMYDKVGTVQLGHIVANLKLRFAAKLNTTCNNNGFKLLKLFQTYDKDNSGTLDLAEFTQVLASFGVQLPEEAEVCLFGNFDKNHDGHLDYTEFISTLVDSEYLTLGFSGMKEPSNAATRTDKMQELEDMLIARFMQITTAGTNKTISDLFKKMDVNRDGTLTRQEFMNAISQLNIHLNIFEVDYIFAKHDTNGDGVLNYAEFAKTFLPDNSNSSVLGESKMTSQMSQRFFMIPK